MKNLKVGIIGIRGLPARYGAFDQFVDQFVKYSNFKFTYAPKYKKDYFSLLSRLDKLKKPNRQKIKNAWKDRIKLSVLLTPDVNKRGAKTKKFFI